MSTPAQRPADHGVAPERTALAWRRTCLALLAGSLAGSRILSVAWGPAGLLLAGVGVVGALVLLALAHRRYRAQLRVVSAGGPLPDGTLPALVAGTAVVVGLVALAFTVTR